MVVGWAAESTTPDLTAKTAMSSPMNWVIVSSSLKWVSRLIQQMRRSITVGCTNRPETL